MTPEERIAKLEIRVDRHEDRYREDIIAIHVKLDAMTSLISKAFVDSAKSACPSPGACVTLSVTQAAVEKKVEKLDERVVGLEKWQWKMLGALVCVAFVMPVFVPIIRKIFRLE